MPEEQGTESLPAAREMGEQESGRREVREEQEEVKVAINGKQEEEIDDGNSFKEVKLEEERKKGGQERRAGLGEDPAKEAAEKREDEGWKEKREDEQNQSEEKTGTNEMQKGVTKEEEGKEEQEEKGKEVTGALNKLNAHRPNTEEEQQGQEDNLKPTASPEPQTLTVDPEPPAGQKERREETVKKGEREMRQTPSPPKVQSAVVRFQSTTHGQRFQVRSRTNELAEPGRPCSMFRSREHAQTHPPCDSNVQEDDNGSEGHEEEVKIKVSELKKRFEA